MRKKLPGWKEPTIKWKLIVLIGGQLLLFFLLIYSLFFWFQDVLEDKVGALARQTLETVTGNMEIQINNNILLSHAIVSDSSLIRLLREHPDFADSSSVWAQVQLLEKMKSYTAGSPQVHSVSIYNPASGRILSTTQGLVKASKAAAAWAEEMKKNPEALAIRADLQGEPAALPELGGPPFITLLRKIPGREQDNLLMIHTYKQVLDPMVGEVGLWDGTGIVMTDTEGKTVFTSGGGTKGAKDLIAAAKGLDSAYGSVNYLGENYIVVRQPSVETGWNVAMVIPHAEIMQDVTAMKGRTVFLLTITCLFFFSMSLVLYTQIFNPIKRLRQSMMTVEKGLNFQPVEIKRMDELGFLQHRFNEMIHNEQQMRSTIVEEQLHKKEIELKFLQSQVNPHFLYNTLDSIYWVAVENDAEEIGDVVLDLSRYFRLSLSRGKEFVSIRETVEHLEYYLRIQQFRHTDKINVHWDVEFGLDDLKIMKLMLQPVVENAIIHGLERTAEACLLTISIRSCGGELQCFVHDTGVGMERSSLRELVREIKRQDGPSEATYGLRNLYQRLRILYGNDMRFHIGSLPGKGTRVSIRIRTTRLEGGETA